MTDGLSRILDVMRDFAEGRVDADDFVARYGPLWRQLRDNQYSAIDRTPGIAERVSQLRGQLLNGEITDEHFRAAVQQEYARLEGVAPRPGDATDEALGHIFVECDAYDPADPEESGNNHLSQSELRGEVQRALDVLDRCS
jgi:hypothetical protein